MATAISTSGTGIGMVIMSPVLQFTIENYGLGHSLTMLAGIACLCFVSAIIYCLEAAKTSTCVNVNDSRSSWRTYKDIFCSPKLVLLFGFTCKELTYVATSYSVVEGRSRLLNMITNRLKHYPSQVPII